jgi:hypothetical protein
VIETDKVSVDVRAPQAGFLEAQLAKAGASLPVRVGHWGREGIGWEEQRRARGEIICRASPGHINHRRFLSI